MVIIRRSFNAREPAPAGRRVPRWVRRRTRRTSRSPPGRGAESRATRSRSPGGRASAAIPASCVHRPRRSETSGRVGVWSSLGSYVPADVRRLIRTMSETKPLWGAPRIHGELLTLGIEISQAGVAKCMVRGGSGWMTRKNLGKSRVRESRMLGSVGAKLNGLATRPSPLQFHAAHSSSPFRIRTPFGSRLRECSDRHAL
jgi:hypothetical protein